MAEIVLRSLTGNQTVDTLLTAVVGIFELAFPGVIRAYYLTGSYQDGTAVTGSDVDLLVIVRGKAADDTLKKLRQMDDWCEMLAPIKLDAGFFDEVEIQQHCPVNLKLSSTLLYGEDIRDEIALPEPAAYRRECMHRAFHRLAWIRQHPKMMTVPLDYPDPDGEFYGYEVRDVSGTPSLERLVGNLLWIATAQLVAKTAGYFSSKREVIQAHQTIFGDTGSSLIQTAYEQCRTKWAYRVPEDPAEQAELRELCASVLAYENHFMALYRAFLMDELQSGDAEAQREAQQRLDRLQFRE